MTTEGVSAAVTVLLAAEPDVADRDEVAMVVRRSREVRSWLDAIDLRCARRTRELAAAGQAEPAESMLGDGGQRTSKDAVAITQRTHACDAMPAFEAALADGKISGGHVDAVARTIRRLDAEIRDSFVGHERQLLVAAINERIEQFERTCTDLVRHLTAERDSRDGSDTEAAELERQRAASTLKQWVDRESGMHHTHAELDPERGAKLTAAIAAHLRRARNRDRSSGVPWNQLQVDAFMNAVDAPVDVPVDGGVNAGVESSTEWRVPEILVLIDQHSLLVGGHEHGLCETSDGVPMPISTVRRMCCDAEIIPAVLGGVGEVTDMGRSRRTVTRAQRRKLRAMHRTCVGHGCEVPFEACRIHHVVFWRNFGATNIDNLVPVCSAHHHLAHEGGWMLTMTPDRIITWARPDGIIHFTGSCIDRAPNGVGSEQRPKLSGRLQPSRQDVA